MLLSSNKPRWCCQSHNQALNLHPHLNLLIPAYQGKRNSSESLLLFSHSLRYCPFLWLSIKGRWKKNSEADNILSVFHGWAKCCMTVISIGSRHPESTGFASVSFPLQTSGEPLRLDRWYSHRASLDVCCPKSPANVD